MSGFRNMMLASMRKRRRVSGFVGGWRGYGRSNSEDASTRDILPGEGTESLYTEVTESHAGTIEDPIPYNGNMELENGKYYSQDGVIYLCTRDTEIPVYQPLKDLVGIYVETASRDAQV